MSRFLTALLLVSVLVAAPSRAADMPERPNVTMGEVEAPADYLDRLAVLLMIRATFDVVEPASIGPALKLVARDIAANGVPPEASSQLDRQLLTEGGYYLVSLRYLALSGGAAWPEGRSESSYERDAVFELEGLEAALIDAVTARRDPLPVLLAGQRILGLTEGYSDLPEQMDRFDDRDALVDAALQSSAAAD